MILSATFSKPATDELFAFGKPFKDFTKVRLFYNKESSMYDVQIYTKTQCMTLHISRSEGEDFIAQNSGTTFKNVTSRTEEEEIVTLANKRGKIRTLRHTLNAKTQNLHEAINRTQDKKKNYLLQSDTLLPFLVKLGIQTKEGKIVAQKNAKFRQINRFLEFVDDLIPYLTERQPEKKFTRENPLRIADFGCGKSYLTFAVYWYLQEKKKIPVDIIGLDLKTDVIEHCSQFAFQCGYEHLHFFTGSIEGFTYEHAPHLIITLHACDTATDAALMHAVAQNTDAILSVPCCQHEINMQLEKKPPMEDTSPLATFMQYGILRERFSALATDALRAEYLTQNGYAVQLLEFIDEDLTPKNLLIRATKKQMANEKTVSASQKRSGSLLNALDARQTLF